MMKIDNTLSFHSHRKLLPVHTYLPRKLPAMFSRNSRNQTFDILSKRFNGAIAESHSNISTRSSVRNILLNSYFQSFRLRESIVQSGNQKGLRFSQNPKESEEYLKSRRKRESPFEKRVSLDSGSRKPNLESVSGAEFDRNQRCETSAGEPERNACLELEKSPKKYEFRRFVSRETWCSKLTSAQRLVFEFCRFVLRKVRRGMIGIRNEEPVVNEFDQFVAKEWLDYVSGLRNSKEIAFNITKETKSICVVFESYDALESFQRSFSKVKNRSFRVPEENVPWNFISSRTKSKSSRHRVLGIVESNGMLTNNFEKIFYILSMASRARITHILEGSLDIRDHYVSTLATRNNTERNHLFNRNSEENEKITCTSSKKDTLESLKKERNTEVNSALRTLVREKMKKGRNFKTCEIPKLKASGVTSINGGEQDRDEVVVCRQPQNLSAIDITEFLTRERKL